MLMKNSLKALIALMLSFSVYLTAGPSTLRAQYICQPAAGGSTTTGSLTVSDPTQSGRVVRDGIASSCTGKTNSLQNSTPVHRVMKLLWRALRILVKKFIPN